MILRDRTAIVTGAGSGIGRAAALIIAGEGAIVGVADRNAEGARGDGRADSRGRRPGKSAGVRPHRRPGARSQFSRIHSRRRPDRHPPQPCRRAGRRRRARRQRRGLRHLVVAQRARPLPRRPHRHAVHEGGWPRCHPQHLVKLRRALRPRDDRLHDDQARGDRHDPADGRRLRALRHSCERALPGLGGYALQRAFHRADGRARGRSKPISAKGCRSDAGQPSRKSPTRCCSWCPTGHPI